HPAQERILVNGNRVDPVVARTLRHPRLHADGLEQLPDEVLELERIHLQEIKPTVELGRRIKFVDELIFRQVEIDNGRHGDQIVRVRRHQRIEVLQARHRIEVFELQLFKHVPVGADADQTRVDLLARRRVTGGDMAVEYHHIYQITSVRFEAFPQRTECRLSNNRSVDLLDLPLGARQRIDHLAGPDVLETPLLWNDPTVRELRLDP